MSLDNVVDMATGSELDDRTGRISNLGTVNSFSFPSSSIPKLGPAQTHIVYSGLLSRSNAAEA
jgi:hypothetical protein